MIKQQLLTYFCEGFAQKKHLCHFLLPCWDCAGRGVESYRQVITILPFFLLFVIGSASRIFVTNWENSIEWMQKARLRMNEDQQAAREITMSCFFFWQQRTSVHSPSTFGLIFLLRSAIRWGLHVYRKIQTCHRLASNGLGELRPTRVFMRMESDSMDCCGTVSLGTNPWCQVPTHVLFRAGLSWIVRSRQADHSLCIVQYCFYYGSYSGEWF